MTVQLTENNSFRLLYSGLSTITALCIIALGCSAKERCYDPPSKRDLHFVEPIKQEGYHDGDFVKYECNEGYTRQDQTSSVLKCMRGAWVTPYNWPWIICNEKCFSEPPKVENARLTRSVQPEGYIDGDFIKYECNEGYVRQRYTSSFLECREGKWQRISDLDGIRCLTVTCPPLHRDPNGAYEAIEGSGFRYGSVYSIKCKPGCKFNDSDPSEDFQIKCYSSGQWSVEQPLCKEYKQAMTTAHPSDAKESDHSSLIYLSLSSLILVILLVAAAAYFIKRKNLLNCGYSRAATEDPEEANQPISVSEKPKSMSTTVPVKSYDKQNEIKASNEYLTE